MYYNFFEFMRFQMITFIIRLIEYFYYNAGQILKDMIFIKKLFLCVSTAHWKLILFLLIFKNKMKIPIKC